jgi:sporulation protein YlmC with PRC-barrel domain
MIWRFEEIRGFAIGATDGEIGTLEDVQFDETSWTVRHLVVDTGTWLPGRAVVLSPRAVVGIDAPGHRVMTDLTRDRVRESPSVDTARPVSGQHEVELATYYGYPFYWTGPYRWGATAAPVPLGPDLRPRGLAAGGPADVEAARRGDPNLHSAREVVGYGIAASDGELGHVQDFLLDEETWAIRYLIVDPRSWWPGAHVVVGVEWLEDVSWESRTVRVGMTRDGVRNAPEWRPEQRVDREWETRLHRHHGRSGYWDRPADRWLIWPYIVP